MQNAILKVQQEIAWWSLIASLSWVAKYILPYTTQNMQVFFAVVSYDYVDGLIQDCSNSIANALELLQSHTAGLIPKGAMPSAGTVLISKFARDFVWLQSFCIPFIDQMTQAEMVYEIQWILNTTFKIKRFLWWQSLEWKYHIFLIW